MKHLLHIVAIGLIFAEPAYAAKSTDEHFLSPDFRSGQAYSNVFSIAHSIRAQGYDESAKRNGGSADYTVVKVDGDSWIFDLNYRYDGQPQARGESELRDNGRSSCSKGKCHPYLDASGLVYNPAFWGVPPKHIVAGMTWKVPLDTPWELGGRNGNQTVTAIRVEPDSGIVTLMREGTSEGLFDGQSTQVKLQRGDQTTEWTLTAGASHWKGYTTFAKGIVLSDELLVTRSDVLRSKDGEELKADERWIMLLNAAPAPTL
jgi:hypothetical protein